MAEEAVSIDMSIPVCASPGAAAAVRSYLRKACGLILQELGEDAVAAIAVSGSAALGEFTAVATAEDDLRLLSDVDLSVVMRTDEQRDAAKSARPALLKRLNTAGEAASMCAPADFGIYSLRDLEVQAPKMGVLEMRASGAVLWGDGEVLRKLPDFSPEELSRSEAVTLLYNRCLESLKVCISPGPLNPCETMNLLYAGAKAYLDAGTALAAYHGRYVTGYKRRLPRIAEIVRERYAGGFGSTGADAFLEGLSFWTDFKIKPDLTEVAARYRSAQGTDGLRVAAWKAWAESRLPLTGVWAALSAGSGAARDGVLETCRGLIGSEPVTRRLRGWKRLVQAGEVPFSRAMRLSLAGSPLHLLRLSAFCILDQLESDGCEGRLDRGSRAFLEANFPVSVGAELKNAGVPAWRAELVEIWSRWRESFCS